MGKIQKSDSINNGINCKLIIKFNNEGSVLWLMEKPKLNLIESDVKVSSCHIFQFQPEQNHYDHYCNGEKIKIERNENLSFPYQISGNHIII